MLNRFQFVLCYYLFIFSTLHIYSQDRNFDKKLDSIYSLREFSNNDDYSLEKRLIYALRAFEISKELKIDTTILKSNRSLSYMYLLLDSYDLYKESNLYNLALAKKLKDTISLASANYNLGYYYHINQKNDSAYFYYSNALNYYNINGKAINESSVLINIANIQQTEKDYLGAEASAIRAIKLLQTFPNSDSVLDDLWILNNLLGINALNLNIYDKAIEYHNKAYILSGKTEFGFYNGLYSKNNIAYVFRKQGLYIKSLEVYNDILETKNFYKDDPSFYALILENIAFTKFLINRSKSVEIESMFQRAYKISDSLDDIITKVGVTVSMSKYYKGIGEISNAHYFANETYTISKKIKKNDILLESLIILSEIEEGESGKKYLKEHIKLSDSLLTKERTVRNRFARIKFETDQIEAENEQISRENLILLILSSALVLALLLLYLFISQRAKNKEIQFVKQQQEANEEIYNLMLAQQDKVEEGRTQEKKRISEELHDGVLGRLFGTRLSLDSLNLVHTDDAIKNRSNYINELKTIELEIRKISHDLNTDFIANSGFLDIIETLIKTQTKAYQLGYDFTHNEDIDWDEISNKNKIHLYRIIQESLQNIYKHANASHVKIGFQLKNDVIIVSINDNGSGFNVNKAKKGIGLKNINSRVTELNGKLTINSVIDQGTEILINVPI